ncbi:MAG: cupin domain-containing protein [Candidatus Omnitrophica bacterium]|nr:cupin domain-containing protein [Candidatus Omnitrophota bacterium]
MKYLKYLVISAVIILACAAVCHFTGANNANMPAVRLVPGDIIWNTDPKLHGLQTAVLAGDPSIAATYTQRIRIPANTILKPHSHPNKGRMVTVLSGTFFFGYGDKFDESKLKRLPPGSFFTEPGEMPHYAVAKEGDVVLQLNAIGPDDTKYVK